MKKAILLCGFCLTLVFQVIAQSPLLLNYQGIARTASGSPIANQAISIRLSIREGSVSGPAFYTETHNIITNNFGLYSLYIGNGAVLSGNMSTISWGGSKKFLEVEIDPNGGTNYTSLGAQQLVSVPYALYADSAKAVIGTVASQGWNLNGNTGINSANDFLGTTDTNAITIKVNNQLSAKISYVPYSSTSFGYQALRSNTANVNAAFGYNSMYTNTNGSANTAMGTHSLFSNVSGDNNTAIGYESLYNSTADYNTGNGYQTLYNNTSGSQNTAVGSQALYFNSTGSQNTYIQSTSGGNTTGNQNTAIGFGALFYNTSGSNNTAIGTNAGVSSCCNNLVNTSSLGYNATVSSSNTISIGNSSITSIRGQVNFSTFSDERIKKNIKNDVPGLTFITQLNPVTYNYDVEKENTLLGIVDTIDLNTKYDIEQIRFSGFIAQDVQKVAQSINYNFSGIDTNGKIIAIRYSDFIPTMVKSIQEQQKQIETMQKQIKELSDLLEKCSKK